MKEEKKMKLNMDIIDVSELNKKIVLAFLEKHQNLNEAERREILKTIQLINNPIFVAKDCSPASKN